MAQYTSTRNHEIGVNAKRAIFQGFSKDKGLFVLPDIKNHQLDIYQLGGLSYQDIAKQVLTELLPDFTSDEINDSIESAYHDNFDSSEIAPIKAVDNFYVLELFHGPTSAFKDVGLQLLPKLMQYVLEDQEKVMILTATSGDTGTAALNGFKDNKNTGITVFYPNGGVSFVQETQMLSTYGDNTNLAAIEGNFDDAQTKVKQILNDEQLSQKLGENISLSSANSINIGRLIPQVVYYFNAYKQLLDQNKIKAGDKVNFTVPTGNFGDVLAGYYAKLMGLPVNKLIIACNANNVIADFFEEGVYDRNRPFFKTCAPSMDIQISSNFERLLYYKSGEDTNLVSQLMSDLESTGQFKVDEDLLATIKQDFDCGFCTDEEIKQEIRSLYEETGYLMDPHTACGYKVMRDFEDKASDIPNILLSTASPYKFIDTVYDAVIDEKEEDQEAMQKIMAVERQTGFTAPDAIKELFGIHTKEQDFVSIEEMRDYVKNKAKEL
ncbi:threonine synthase [Holzapfeliella sp. JNUCC 80]